MQGLSHLQICFLGPENSLSFLQKNLESMGSMFEILGDQCWEGKDDQLADSFFKNWRGDISEEEVEKIENHGTILYVTPKECSAPYLDIAVEALQMIQFMLGNGAIAAKICGSDMVYNVESWQKIAQEATELVERGDRHQLFHVCSSAFVRRGIESDYCYETTGYHFLGLPEIYIPMETIDALEILAQTEQLAEEIWERGIDTIQETYNAEWSEDFLHTEDDPCYNSFGILIFPE